MKRKTRIASVGLFVLFFLLYNAPFLSIPKGMTNGLPNLMIYIGSFWIILIVLMRIIFSDKKENKTY